jgi:hypothetical protein
MRSRYRNREPYAERLEIALTLEQKRRAFEIADRRQISVGALVRQAIDSVSRDADDRALEASR